MLGKLIRSFTGSDNGTKAINILRNTLLPLTLNGFALSDYLDSVF